MTPSRSLIAIFPVLQRLAKFQSQQGDRGNLTEQTQDNRSSICIFEIGWENKCPTPNSLILAIENWLRFHQCFRV